MQFYLYCLQGKWIIDMYSTVQQIIISYESNTWFMFYVSMTSRHLFRRSPPCSGPSCDTNCQTGPFLYHFTHSLIWPLGWGESKLKHNYGICHLYNTEIIWYGISLTLVCFLEHLVLGIHCIIWTFVTRRSLHTSRRMNMSIFWINYTRHYKQCSLL